MGCPFFSSECQAIHGIFFTCCAHGVFLPIGNTPALTCDKGKLHTTHIACVASGLWKSTRHRAGSDGTAQHSWECAPGERVSLSMSMASIRRRRRTNCLVKAICM